MRDLICMQECLLFPFEVFRIALLLEYPHLKTLSLSLSNTIYHEILVHEGLTVNIVDSYPQTENG